MEPKPVDFLYPDKYKLKTEGKCPFCKAVIGEFRNAVSEREYRISGLCQTCQDQVFGED